MSMVIVRKHGDKWCLIKAEESPRTSFSTGTLQQVRSPYRTNFLFWTGDGWAGQNVFAMLFDTEDEARAYLDENRGTIESQPE